MHENSQNQNEQGGREGLHAMGPGGGLEGWEKQWEGAKDSAKASRG